MPPSITKALPLTKRASSPARKAMPAATSSGVPIRPSSWRSSMARRAAAGSGASARILPIHSLLTVPGQMALARMPAAA